MAQVSLETLMVWGWLALAAALGLLSGLIARLIPAPAPVAPTRLPIRTVGRPARFLRDSMTPCVLPLAARRDTARLMAGTAATPAPGMPGARIRPALTLVWAADRVASRPLSAERRHSELTLAADGHIGERTAAADQGLADGAKQPLQRGRVEPVHVKLHHFDNSRNNDNASRPQDIIRCLSKYLPLRPAADRARSPVQAGDGSSGRSGRPPLQRPERMDLP